MRFKNFSSEPVHITFKAWTHPKHGGYIELGTTFDPGEVSAEYEPEDPIAKRLIEAHPELRPYTLPTLWERLLLDDPFDTSLEDAEKAALLGLEKP